VAVGLRQEAEEAALVERMIEMKSRGVRWDAEGVVVAW
jgi:hypothetical protein